MTDYTYFVRGRMAEKPVRFFVGAPSKRRLLRYVGFAEIQVDEVKCLGRVEKLPKDLADRFLKGI
jgi:hypothetical protein